MAGVLIGQAYFLRFDPKLRAAMQPYAPLGALYAAAVLRARGREVALFDAMLARSERDWETALERERPRRAVLYEDSFNYLSKMCLGRMREAALVMIGMAKARGSIVAVAGSDASADPGPYLAAGADAVVAGEGEETLAELLDALDAGAALEGVRGLVFRGGDGRLVRTPPRPFLRDLDALPRPAWEMVDVERYRRLWRSRHGYFSMNLVTTRGCPYHCNWCAKPIYGQRYAVRSPESVAEELAWLVRTYAPDHVSFADDIFGLQPGWVERFAGAVARAGARTPFKCLSRADLLRGEVVAALKAAGCRTVWLGAESGSQRILDAMEKGIRVEQVRQAARLLRAQGIEVGFFLQFGYPGETRADIEATLELVRDCRPDDIGISVSYPLPGTKFHARVAEQLGARRHWRDSADLAMLYRGPFGTDFYRALHRAVHTEFRLLRLRAARPASLHQRAAALYHAARLGLDRWRAFRLARAGEGAIAPLAPVLSPREAARPSEPEG